VNLGFILFLAVDHVITDTVSKSRRTGGHRIESSTFNVQHSKRSSRAISRIRGPIGLIVSVSGLIDVGYRTPCIITVHVPAG